jgi:hypothetical protein
MFLLPFNDAKANIYNQTENSPALFFPGFFARFFFSFGLALFEQEKLTEHFGQFCHFFTHWWQIGEK